MRAARSHRGSGCARPSSDKEHVMGKLRFTLAGLMGAVLVAAVGLAALRNPTESWAGGMLLLTCGTLALAVIGAITRRGARRTWWLGFGLFGWGYLVLSGCWSATNLVAQSSTGIFDKLPTTSV